MRRARSGGQPPQLPSDAERRKENADATRGPPRAAVERLLSRRDIPLREKTLWRMLYETAAHASEILAPNVEDLDPEQRRALVRSKGGDTEFVYRVAYRCGRQRRGIGHDAGVVAFAGGFRAPFYRYWLSGFLADFGNGVRLAAFPLLAAQLTRSPAAVAAVTTVQGLPWVLLGTGAGVVVDRVDRRRLMVMVDTARAALVAALAAAVLVHGAGLWLIYLTAFLSGAGSALRSTAEVTCVPRLVEPGDLDKANGRVIAGQIVGSELAGPAAGGWLFGLAAVLPFAVNAGTLGIAVLLLLTLPGVFAPPPRQQEPGARTWVSSARHDLGEGLRWVWRHAAIRDVTIMAGVVSAMDAAWFAVFVLYVMKVLHQQPGAYGLLLAVGAVGGITAGGAAAALTRRIGPWRSLLAAGLVMAASQAALGLTGNVIVAALLQMPGSGAFALFNVTAVTMRQRQVPDALLGRVTSVYGTVTQGAEALGAIAGGTVAAAAGIRAPMLIGAGPIAAVTILLAWRHRGGQELPAG